jgi:hypothetical protein
VFTPPNTTSSPVAFVNPADPANTDETTPFFTK